MATRNPQLTAVARSLRALVEEIKADRGEVADYLIVDDVLERLPRYAAELEAAGGHERCDNCDGIDPASCVNA